MCATSFDQRAQVALSEADYWGLGEATIGAVVAALGGAPRPVVLDRARIDCQFRELALDHAAQCPRTGGLALPTKVALARPTGVGRALATCEIPIEGRDEWLAAAGLRA